VWDRYHSPVHRFKALGREVTAFGVVGALAFVVDNGGYTLLVFGPTGTGHGPLHGSPVLGSVLATTIATVFSWVGNRYWTYRHQRRERISHELVLFVAVNAVGLIITAGMVLVSRDVFGLHSVFSDNAARIVGWVIATLFRFFSYRRVVFVTAPDPG
jgi:putative flippase GtrA